MKTPIEKLIDHIKTKEDDKSIYVMAILDKKILDNLISEEQRIFRNKAELLFEGFKDGYQAATDSFIGTNEHAKEVNK